MRPAGGKAGIKHPTISEERRLTRGRLTPGAAVPDLGLDALAWVERGNRTARLVLSYHAAHCLLGS